MLQKNADREYTSQELFLFYHYNYEAVVVVLSNPQAKLPFFLLEPAVSTVLFDFSHANLAYSHFSKTQKIAQTKDLLFL